MPPNTQIMNYCVVYVCSFSRLSHDSGSAGAAVDPVCSSHLLGRGTADHLDPRSRSTYCEDFILKNRLSEANSFNILSHVLVFSNTNRRPRCPLDVVGAAVLQGGGPDAISGVYWPAGRCEAPPRPLIRGLPGRPHCLPDTSMLITQCGPVTEGGCPSA